MGLAIGLLSLALAAALIYFGLPDKQGNSPRFLRFGAALVLYPRSPGRSGLWRGRTVFSRMNQAVGNIQEIGQPVDSQSGDDFQPWVEPLYLGVNFRADLRHETLAAVVCQTHQDRSANST
jgi:hypothetical protein